MTVMTLEELRELRDGALLVCDVDEGDPDAPKIYWVVIGELVGPETG
jgi:hypothetical protein